MQLGFIAKEQGGSMGFQRETERLKSNGQQQQNACQWWKLIKRTIRVRVDSGSTERIIAEARQG